MLSFFLGARKRGHTVERIPEENHAGLDDTTDLINPQVIESHPSGPVVNLARFRVLPERTRLAITNTIIVSQLGPPCLGGRGEANSQRPRIPRPLLPQCKPPQLTSLSQHRSCGRRNRILIPANIQHKRTETEHECGDQERQPKPDVSLCIDHGDGTRQSTDVNHAVEVHEDTRDGLAWVDDHAFAGFGEGSDVGTRFFILFCD